MHSKILAFLIAGAIVIIVSLALPVSAGDQVVHEVIPTIETSADISEETQPDENPESSEEFHPDNPEPSETENDPLTQPELSPDEDVTPPDSEQGIEQPETEQKTPPAEITPEDFVTEPSTINTGFSENTLELQNSDYLTQVEDNWDIPSPYVVDTRPCAWRNCPRKVPFGKTNYLCGVHMCSNSTCSRPIYNLDSTKCALHLGKTFKCQAGLGGGKTCGATPYSGSSLCYKHMCPGCLGPGYIDQPYGGKLCPYCEQCWVQGCPNDSTCTNECDEHCPHSCKVHHENHCATCHGAGNCCTCNTCSHTCKIHHEDHCLTCHGAGNCCDCNTCSHICKEHHLDHCAVCHTEPCVCYPADPVIQVGAWDSSDNSVTISISSDRAAEIEIYTQSGTKVDTIASASGTYTFYHDSVHQNGAYYVRVKNDAGYNPGSFSFIVSGLDREAPDAHSVKVSPSGWAKEKTITATASDQTNVLLTLQYADGSPVPGTSEQEGSASWTITEQLSAAKTFKLVSKDKWGYTSNVSFTVDKIDTVQPTRPTAAKTPSVVWHNAAVTVKLSGGTAASGIDHYEYRINNGSWQSGDSVSFSTQGVHKVEARAVSEVGLVSDIESSTIQIDTTKPSGSYTLSHQPGTWTTSAVTIQFTPSDAGGSGVKSVTLPNGSSASNLNNISYTASQNGSYEFIVTDNAGNVGKVVVKVDNIAMLDVTVTLNSPFVISPDDDKVYGGEIHFENRSNVPVKLSVTNLAPVGNAPAIVAHDSRDWKTLSVSQTKKNIAIGYVGNGKDVWITIGGEHVLGTVQKGGNAVYTMKARYGYAWDKPQSLNYAMTVKISVDQ